MSTPLPSYREQLASVNAAIVAIEGGAQQYTNGNLQLTRASLRDLYDERTRLTPLAMREERNEAAGGRGGIRIGYIR